MKFASPNVLWFLLVVPFMALYLIFLRPSNLPSFRFSSSQLLGNLLDPLRLRKIALWPGLLRILAVVCLIIALARPQRGLRSEEMTTKATDIMLCLDASRSMLSIDFKPDNRFEVAKQVVQEFIKGREFDRLGLVIFAENAITQCPLTLDKTALLTITDQLKVGVIPPDQTAIGVGLATAVNRLKNSNAKSKVIILVTDGSNNAGSIDPITAAKTAASYKIKIYSIGAGSPEGGMMPVDDPIFGQRMVQIKSDLDEDMLLKVAIETGGKYFRAKSEGGLKDIFHEIDGLEKTDITVKEYVDYEDLYVFFMLLSLFFLAGELLISKTFLRTVP